MRTVVIVLALLLSLPAPVRAAELVVSAAHSLMNAFQAMQPDFQKAHAGVTLTFNFAASGQLLRQIEQGAPVDVFATADLETMDKAQAKGLLDAASRGNFAANTLVLALPTGSTQAVASARDLLRQEVGRIAIGNPETVPVGRYARQALTAEKLWEPLAPKLIMAESVRQALDYVARGEVDAAIVYATDVMVAADKARIAAVLPGHAPILYPVAALAGSRNAQAARDFVAFVRGPRGQAILRQFGFAPAG